MLKKGCKQSILIVEKGRAVEDRRCPKNMMGRCVNCKPYCHIITGFSGAGADSRVEGLGNTDEVKAIRTRAIQAGLKLVNCPIRHLGTEKAQELYYAIEQHLLKNGVETPPRCRIAL